MKVYTVHYGDGAEGLIVRLDPQNSTSNIIGPWPHSLPSQTLQLEHWEESGFPPVASDIERDEVFAK